MRTRCVCIGEAPVRSLLFPLPVAPGAHYAQPQVSGSVSGCRSVIPSHSHPIDLLIGSHSAVNPNDLESLSKIEILYHHGAHGDTEEFFERDG